MSGAHVLMEPCTANILFNNRNYHRIKSNTSPKKSIAITGEKFSKLAPNFNRQI